MKPLATLRFLVHVDEMTPTDIEVLKERHGHRTPFPRIIEREIAEHLASLGLSVRVMKE